MADKKIRGEQNRFIEGTNIEKHREWRGLKDTWYDYTQWIKLLGIVMKFVAISPFRIARGVLEYRWMGSYLAAFNMPISYPRPRRKRAARSRWSWRRLLSAQAAGRCPAACAATAARRRRAYTRTW